MNTHNAADMKSGRVSVVENPIQDREPDAASAGQRLEADLRRALPRNEFQLRYQPKVSCRSGRIPGVEALILWQHPSRGLVSPGEVLPMREQSGLIVPVGAWVLRSAGKQARAWH